MSRLQSLFRRRRLEADMKAELREHLRLATEEKIAAGMSPADARRAASLECGGLDQARESYRDARSFVWLENLLRDFRHAARGLGKKPGFVFVAVLVLGLGIGAASGFFSLFKAIALTHFPYPKAERVMHVWGCSIDDPQDTDPLSAPDYLDLRERTTTLEHFGLYYPDLVNLGGDQPKAVTGINCTEGVLPALGITPLFGRWFTADDMRRGGPPVTIISHAFWQQQCAEDQNIIGKSIRLNGRDVEVVGVMPAHFEFHSMWSSNAISPIFQPLRIQPHHGRGSLGFLGVARIKADATHTHASAELAAIARQLAKEHPNSNHNRSFRLVTLSEAILRGGGQGHLTILVGLAGCVLLVVCANVASMLLARGRGRQAEFAIRLALGTGRGGIVRLVFAEASLLAFGGVLLGLLVAWGLQQFFLSWSDSGPVQLLQRMSLDISVFAFTAGVAFFATVISGLPAALSAMNVPLIESIKSGVGIGNTRSQHRFLGLLISGQIAATVCLVTMALVFASAALHQVAANSALASDHVLTTQIALRGPKYNQSSSQEDFWKSLADRSAALPGVRAVAITSKLPLLGGNNSQILVEGEDYDATANRTSVEVSVISADYFAAMGIALTQGRIFTQTDRLNTFKASASASAQSAPHIMPAIVNRAFVERFWPGENVLGRTFRNNSPQPNYVAEIVGVCDDVRQWSADVKPQPEMFFSLGNYGRLDSAHLVIRSAMEAGALTPALHHIMREIDPDLPLINPRTMRKLVDERTSMARRMALVIEGLAITGLLITGIGIYGALAYMISQRTREIGVRVALGASRSSIVKLVYRQSLGWLLGGLAVGLPLTFGAVFVMRSLFTSNNTLDPRFPALGFAIALAALLIAGWLPARRALRINPIEALRAE